MNRSPAEPGGLSRSLPPQQPLVIQAHTFISQLTQIQTLVLSLSDLSDLHRLPSTPHRPLHSGSIYPHLPKAPAPLLSPPDLPLILAPVSLCLHFTLLRNNRPTEASAPGGSSLSPARPPSSCNCSSP